MKKAFKPRRSEKTINVIESIWFGCRFAFFINFCVHCTLYMCRALKYEKKIDFKLGNYLLGLWKLFAMKRKPKIVNCLIWHRIKLQIVHSHPNSAGMWWWPIGHIYIHTQIYYTNTYKCAQAGVRSSFYMVGNFCYKPEYFHDRGGPKVEEKSVRRLDSHDFPIRCSASINWISAYDWWRCCFGDILIWIVTLLWLFLMQLLYFVCVYLFTFQSVPTNWVDFILNVNVFCIFFDYFICILLDQK